MIFRGFVLLSLALAGLGLVPKNTLSMPSTSIDTRVLSQASTSMKHRSVLEVVHWLDQQPVVARAIQERDGRTVDVRFRDGTRGAILPAGSSHPPAATAQPQPRLLPLIRAHAPGARALVLEPFSAQLDPGGGALEIDQLQKAGYQVDQLRDAAVTVQSMSAISHYSVVYMHTHSDANLGLGVVATGQVANDDPAVAPLIQNGTVIKITVSGFSNVYYGITSAYVQTYLGQFPSSSILFLNGCNMLQAPNFWQALQSKGLSTMVSWDKEASSVDNYFAGGWFFAEMNQGLSVASAIAALKAAGYGTSASPQGGMATLGYLGDGGVTLQSAAQAAPGGSGPPTAPALSPSPVPQTPTPLPTTPPTRTPTPLPTATLTPVPAPPLTIQLKHRVNPGGRQIVTIKSAPDTILHIRVAFPSGDSRTAVTATDSSGVGRYVFPQHGNRITYNHVFATVTVQAIKNGAVAQRTMQYRVGWGRIDVAVQPREQVVGQDVTIWVHSRARTPIVVSLIFPNGSRTRFNDATSGQGWTFIRYRVDRNRTSGNHHAVAVAAQVKLAGRWYTGETTFKIT